MNIKIYFNTIFIELSGATQKPSLNQQVKTYTIEKSTTKQLDKIIHEFLLSRESKSFRLICHSVSEVFEELKKHFIYIEAAGGLIEKNGSYLFIFRNDLWDLPKGKLEKNEKIADGAVRECEEECGVKNLEIGKELDATYHLYSYKGSYALKKSYWFYMKTDYNKPLIPQLEENITEVKWFSKDEIKHTVLPLTYFTIQNVIEAALLV